MCQKQSLSALRQIQAHMKRYLIELFLLLKITRSLMYSSTAHLKPLTFWVYSGPVSYFLSLWKVWRQKLLQGLEEHFLQMSFSRAYTYFRSKVLSYKLVLRIPAYHDKTGGFTAALNRLICSRVSVTKRLLSWPKEPQMLRASWTISMAVKITCWMHWTSCLWRKSRWAKLAP